MPGLVSVVMPVLNAAEWLPEAIESILVQTHRDLELIIVDDGSEDTSNEVATAAAKGDGRVRTLSLPRDPTSTTSGRAANAGIAVAHGRYIARMDADDVALPERLALQLGFIEQHELDGCGGLAESFGADERHYWFPESHAGVVRELIFRVGILHPTLLARAELMRGLPYREDVSHEDYEWQVRAVGAGARLGNLQQVVLRHRVHESQANRRHRDLFARDLRRFRFEHVTRSFPVRSPAQYQALAWIAEEAELAPDELPETAEWLLRLSDIPDDELRRKMVVRWQRSCDRAGLPADDPQRDEVTARIRGG